MKVIILAIKLMTKITLKFTIAIHEDMATKALAFLGHIHGILFQIALNPINFFNP